MTISPFIFLLYTKMKHYTAIAVVAIIIILLAGTVVTLSSAKEPTIEQRASAELLGVLREIERTQEYADRNSEARGRKEAILKCLNSGACEDF